MVYIYVQYISKMPRSYDHSPIIHTNMRPAQCFVRFLMYTTTIVDLPYIYQLLSSSPSNLVGQSLVGESLPGCLDDVHLVPRAGCLSGEILEAGGAREFEDQMLDAETEA